MSDSFQFTSRLTRTIETASFSLLVLSRQCDLYPHRISEFMRGRTFGAITRERVIRLGAFLGLSPDESVKVARRG